MFIENTINQNEKLIELAFSLHQSGVINPDSYLLDVDQFLSNARIMLEEANKLNIRLFFMLKQVGRNPFLAKKLVELGFPGAVVVDYNEAKMMMKHQIPICNVGHLVQIPHGMIKEIVEYGVEFVTVYSYEKIIAIDKAAKECGKKQKLLLRVVDKGDLIYSGQTAGFYLNELEELVKKVNSLGNVEITGVTGFPSFLYNAQNNICEPTHNLSTVLKAKELLISYGINCEEINLPSSTCTDTLSKIASFGGTSAEPGHGLSGTTPLHAHKILPEKPCVVYVSEVSHHFDKDSYCFGGGYYRRSHVENALVGKSVSQFEKTKVILPDMDSIDYHFGLRGKFDIHDTVLMAFRFQIFVNRSNLILVEGLSHNQWKLHMYTSLGEKI